jgi:septation ring formation regulator EzrA
MEGKTEYLKLKEPSDILSYVQRVVNRLRREDLEIDPVFIGKIIYLLNTWISAYKMNLEYVELKELREEVKQIKEKMEANYDTGKPKGR